ncbi:MAG: Holliday junction branch migration protein RuvA [Spirochaetota bacterium]|nr:MAG: Holliday junction branch migration protein RuvA [Spirochaetota bacterium]
MIAFLRGVLKELDNNFCIIDVNGVGYEVFCSSRTLNDLGELISHDTPEVELYTRLIHRDECLDLYGFLHKDEYNLFNLLITVSGVGPKQAIKILGNTRVPDIARAIVHEDTAFLMGLSGIGKKKSQQIIFELKEKLKTAFAVPSTDGASLYVEAISALESLGFTKNESKDAVEKAIAITPDEQDVGKIIESALKQLS